MIKPEEIITLDFETYFDSDYTLRKLSTSEYIRDDRFKAQCVGIKMGTADVVWIPDVNVEEALRSIDWPSYALLAHHTQFDGFILSDRYGVHPAYYLDTLSMGRGLHSIGVGASLDALAQYYGLGHKLPEILSKTKGVRDLPPEVMAELGLYCAVDTQLCCDLFYQMVEHYEPDELDLIHETCSMFCEPVLRVDIPRATTALQQEKDTKAQKILLADRDPANLSSNPKFAAVLQDLGIDPPMKTSPTTGKPTFAFAKSDEGLQALMTHEDEAVRAVVDARLAVKSTLNETRAQRLIDEGANDRTLPVYLKYYGAHTGRWSGGNKMNLQNLPRGGELRRSVIAPPGYVLCVSDSAQIEARMLAWVAGEIGVLEQFRNGEDVYKHMAAQIFNVPLPDVTPTQRFVGKVCLGEDTKVLTNKGVKRILNVKITDMVWDGVEWVNHNGLLFQGTSEVINLQGVSITPDHKIYTGAEWIPAKSLAHDDGTLSQALAHAQANLPSPATWPENVADAKASSSHAIADAQNIWSTRITLKISKARAVTLALKARLRKNAIGFTQKLCPTMPTALACSIAFLHVSPAAPTQTTPATNTTEGAGSKYTARGAKTVLPSCGMSKHSPVGTTRYWNWIAKTMTGITNRATSALSRARKTTATNAKSASSNDESMNWKPVYDLANAGPRQRFTIVTDAGPLIVHNCVLGLGYGMGWRKFLMTITLGLMGPKMDLTPDEAVTVVNGYRQARHRTVGYWRKCDDLLQHMLYDMDAELGILQLNGTENKLYLPNNMYLEYPGLCQSNDGFVYFDYENADIMARGGRPNPKRGKKIYGGLLTENIVQALARIVVGKQLLAIAKRYKVATTTHDEIVAVVPEAEADDGMAFMLDVMRTPPDWCADLPLNAEGGFAREYSK